MKKFLALMALLLCLTSMPTYASAASFDLQATLQASHPDLEAARIDADSRGDTLASMCYVGVENYLDSHPLPNFSLPKPVGVVSAFQATRDGFKNAHSVKTLLSNGTPVEIEVACGPLEMDARQDVTNAFMDLSILGIKIF